MLALRIPRHVFIALALVAACSGDGSRGPNDLAPPSGPAIYLALGDDVPPGTSERIRGHVEAVAARPVVIGAPTGEVAAGSMLLSIGSSPASRELIPASELAALGPEGFIVRSGVVGGVPTLAADGNPLARPFGRGDIGDGFAGYAVLEKLGWGFLHPLAPTIPSSLPQAPPEVDESHAPRWWLRGLQIHTMHPIELTNVLNGWGTDGPDDEQGFTDQLAHWESTVEWLVANRQNRVHWVLLWGRPWAEFADSDRRIDRLARVVDIGHDHALGVGVDVPIALAQQRAFRLLRSEGTLDEEMAEIRERIDHVMRAGFDYLASENGTSEFTHADDDRMLAWMNTLASHLADTYGADSLMKVHISSGQVASSHVDPETGEPLNVNFLPHYADPRLGVLPHTVQHYALDDPAPTYGNENFAAMRDFLHSQAGKRLTVWHPESAYWVSFDIDVPLFLPVYAERRFHDLRLLAGDEQSGRMGGEPGTRMDGQLVFSSGWEWGYWLGDVIAARAAWDPRLDLPEAEAFEALLRDALHVFGPRRDELVRAIVDTAAAQNELLIRGRIDGTPPQDIEQRSGQAYLQGHDAWDDVSNLASKLPLVPDGFLVTQPQKLGLVDMRNPLHGGPGYSAEIEPLLAEIEGRLSDLADRFEAAGSGVPVPARPLFDELVDASRVTALRATHVHGLYDYVDAFWELGSGEWREGRLADAVDARRQALEVVHRREQSYRVDPELVAGWADGPTAYGYRYLWTVRNLFYWMRDEIKAVDTPLSPCVLNLVDPIEVGLGEGPNADAAETARDVLTDLGIGSSITDCLRAPATEPTF